VLGFQKVLIPVDFGDHTDRVIEAGVRVLDPAGEAVLLHVVEWMPVVTEGTFGVYAHRKDIDRLRDLSRQKLEEIARRHPGVPLRLEVLEGRAAPAILEAAEAMRPDLIVMGTHGRSKLDHLLLGSVTERVLRKARCSVLAVRA
jgi:nucleotide-binding universal stress UspA family protein